MSGDNLEFKWGKKRSVGGKNRDVQFYASFRFDGVDYKLADCVYMWKDEETEPFVGKIVKIWQDKCRKVKVLWFFKPSEISNHLGDDLQVSENELFLASGDGAGIANVNPLEAIAGKCNVVCISKDGRNPQPVKEELEAADYVFYRTFDVGQLIVSEMIPDKIPGIDIKFIFNQREDQQSNVPTRKGTELLPGNECCIDRKENGVYLKKTSEDRSYTSQKGNAVRNSHLPGLDVGDEMNNRSFKKPKFEKDDNYQKKRIQHGDILSQKPGEDNESNMPLNVSNDLVCMLPKVETDASDVQIKGKSNFGRRSNGIEEAVLPNDGNDLVHEPPVVETDGCDALSKFGKESNVIEKAVLSVKRKLDEEVQRAVISKRPKGSDHTLNKQINPSRSFTEVTRKPDADKRRWFKELPWEERMENAYRQGALVLLENLDPSYSSSDVEDIILHGFNESCTAKIVYCASNCSPFSGQAFVVFKTKDAAEKVVAKLEHGCLMLSNGRPLIGSFGNPCIPGKETLVGHFGIDKLAVQLSREKKEAVSTSHCSQPNSIEYEFAMDWCLLHERYNLKRSLLQKQHAVDLKKAMAELKTKLN